jgi:hypothetical protein
VLGSHFEKYFQSPVGNGKNETVSEDSIKIVEGLKNY